MSSMRELVVGSMPSTKFDKQCALLDRKLDTQLSGFVRIIFAARVLGFLAILKNFSRSADPVEFCGLLRSETNLNLVPSCMRTS